MKKVYCIRQYPKSILSVVLMAIFLHYGCVPSVSLFSETAYQQAIELKVQSIKTMDLATNPFENHKDNVEALQFDLQKAYEFAKGRPNNEHTTRQWSIIIDPEENMISGFLARWEQAGTLSKSFIFEAKETISEGFDTVIGLESGKIKP